MKAKLTLVTVRLDQMTGDYLITCRICGKLGPMRSYWPAARIARQHEEIHDADELR